MLAEVTRYSVHRLLTRIIKENHKNDKIHHILSEITIFFAYVKTNELGLRKWWESDETNDAKVMRK